MKPKPKVGDKLFSLAINNAARTYKSRDHELTPVVVTKVGRKYFSASEDKHRITEYHLDTWCEKTNYSPNSRLYSSEQEWIDEKECHVICKQIGEHFMYGANKAGLTIETLREIKELIERPI